jgi:hypothetical protein
MPAHRDIRNTDKNQRAAHTGHAAKTPVTPTLAPATDAPPCLAPRCLARSRSVPTYRTRDSNAELESAARAQQKALSKKSKLLPRAMCAFYRCGQVPSFGGTSKLRQRTSRTARLRENESQKKARDANGTSQEPQTLTSSPAEQRREHEQKPGNAQGRAHCEHPATRPVVVRGDAGSGVMKSS